jgi:chromate transporter
MSQIAHLLTIFGELSVLAVGGIAPVLPEMQRQVVDVYHYMDRSTFADIFALAQAAPGPNMMVSTLVGWRVAGLTGALAATAGMIGPSSLLTFVTVKLWHRFRDKLWRRLVQAGLVPLTVGLVGAGAALLAASTTHGWVTGAVTVVTALALVLTKVHPLAMLALGTAAGALLY